MASLSRCLRTHRAALEAAGVDVGALEARVREIRELDGDTSQGAAMTAVEELLDAAEGERAALSEQIQARGGEVPPRPSVTRPAAAESDSDDGHQQTL